MVHVKIMVQIYSLEAWKPKTVGIKIKEFVICCKKKGAYLILKVISKN